MYRSRLVLALALALSVPAIAQEEFDWSRVAPVEKLMARRAARIDALRELGELIKTLPVGGGASLRDLQPELSAFLAGAQEVGEPEFAGSGYCKLKMMLPAERVIAEAKALAHRRGAPLDVDGLARATGQALEVTGLGRPRSAPPVPPAELRQGRGDPAPPDERQGRVDPPAAPQADPPRVREGWQPWVPEQDPGRLADRERWEREFAERAQRWFAEREQAWRSPHPWAAPGAPATDWSMEEQWEQARPGEAGWRILPDGTRIRLVSERVIERAPVRRGPLVDPRTGEQVYEETITERVIERRYVVR